MFRSSLTNSLRTSSKSSLFAMVATAALFPSVAQGQSSEATSVHVQSVDISEWLQEPFGFWWREGYSGLAAVEVLVLDDLGNPAEGAVVAGTFSGDLLSKKGDTVSGVTGPDGVVTLWMSKAVRFHLGSLHSITFCVTDVSASLPHNSEEDAADCDTIWFGLY